MKDELIGILRLPANNEEVRVTARQERRYADCPSLDSPACIELDIGSGCGSYEGFAVDLSPAETTALAGMLLLAALSQTDKTSQT